MEVFFDFTVSLPFSISADEVLPQADGEVVSKLVKKHELVFIPGAGHNFSKHEEEVVEHISKWLRARL